MSGRITPIRQRGRDRSNSASEWIGGLIQSPFLIEDEDERYQAGILIWLEAQTELVVGQEVIGPENAEGAIARVLHAAMMRPLAGPPRRPDRIRVADARLASELREEVGDAIPIIIEPTPELERLGEDMFDFLARENERASYLEEGRVPPATMARLFAAAQRLFKLRPWKVADESQVLRMDIPALDVEGACVSVIGALGENAGLLIFPSLAGYEAFLSAAEELMVQPGALDFGTELLALNFERKANLPATMVQEVRRYGWPVANAKAYPIVECRGRDGIVRPLTDREVRIVAGCAAAFSAFFSRHEDIFLLDDIEPVLESFRDPDDLEVCLTAPYANFNAWETVPEEAPGSDAELSAAQQAAWLSVWEVTEVDPGRTVSVRDLLSHETRLISETTASKSVILRDALLARVIDVNETSIFDGLHPRSLPPIWAAQVLHSARTKLRRKKAVPVERLRDEGFCLYLTRRWEECVAELDEHSSRRPRLHNTDGDPLLLTIDHFEIASGEGHAVKELLAGIAIAESLESGEKNAIYVFMNPGDPKRELHEGTVFGRARLINQILQIESNSRSRADALRRRVETVCGDRIRHRAREHSDPLSAAAEQPEGDRALEPPTPREIRLLLDFKERHYADWADQPLPALEGKTPRQAVRTSVGRDLVDILIKDMENREHRLAGRTAFDFSAIRRELRLED